jgi:hypothetical protein
MMLKVGQGGSVPFAHNVKLVLGWQSCGFSSVRAAMLAVCSIQTAVFTRTAARTFKKSHAVWFLYCCLQALQPQVFVSVPRLWNRIYDRVMATMREANPVKRRLFERAFAYKRAALEAGEWRRCRHVAVADGDGRSRAELLGHFTCP